MTTREILDNDRWNIELDQSKALVRVLRKDSQTRSIDEMQRLYAEVDALLNSLGRARHVLLVDLRTSPVRNDPEWEQAAGQLRPKLFKGFSRVAVLVKTAVGALQIQRYSREDNLDLHIFFDEQEALVYLAGRRPPRP